ncbi:MAG: arginine--tRNA ligase [Candidatus Firestonebacteria bacterium]
MKKNIKSYLKEEIKNNLIKIYKIKDIPEINFEVPRFTKFGDISCNIALSLSKILNKSPIEIAEEIVKNIRIDKELISKVDMAGAGFINFFFSEKYLSGLLIEIEENENFAKSDEGKGKKVNIEFVSANPVGPLNIVNARAAAVGNSLSNLLENIGYNVTKEYYINDVGNQIEIFGKSISLRYEELLGKKIDFPQDFYAGEYIKDIARRIINEEGDKYISLGEDERIKLFKEKGLEWMIGIQRKSLEDYGVKFDVWFKEIDLHISGQVKRAIEVFEKNQYTEKKEDALWFKSTLFGDDKDRVLQKNDGTYTYLAADIAYHKNKYDRGFEQIIDIWGPDHHGYIPRMRGAVQAFGRDVATFNVLIAQQVNLIKDGKPFKMSKREGSFVTMNELVSEVGADAAKYFFIRRSLNSHLDFDIDQAKKQSNENPVYYVQYAHARICNIIEFAKSGEIKLKSVKESKLELLKESEEIELMRKISVFQDTLIFSGISYQPHLVCKYLEELASSFHSFYTKHRVITDDKDLTYSRLVLCNAVKIVLKKGLDILGVSAPDRM